MKGVSLEEDTPFCFVVGGKEPGFRRGGFVKHPGKPLSLYF